MIRSLRVFGSSGSSGKYAAPAFNIPRSAITSAGPRLMETPISVSGPAPEEIKWRATPLAAITSSR